MHRLLILSVMTLCFAGGLVAPAFANEYCPPVTIAAGQYCSCIVRNYGTTGHESVTITLYAGNSVAKTCAVSIAAGVDFKCEIQFVAASSCGCKVIGDAPSSRTAICVDPGDSTPLTCEPCK